MEICLNSVKLNSTSCSFKYVYTTYCASLLQKYIVLIHSTCIPITLCTYFHGILYYIIVIKINLFKC